MTRRLAAALAVMLAASASAQTAGEASVAAKQTRSPVDPRLAGFTGAAPSQRRLAAPVRTWPMLVRSDGIVIDAASNGDPRALLAELSALGLRDGVVSGNAVSGVLPFDAIPALSSCRHLAVARPAMATTRQALEERTVAHAERAVAHAERAHADAGRGSVTSQGVAAMQADRLPRGVDGRGISVGVLADSFDCRGGAAQDVASGDLPAGVTVLDDTNLASCFDEGRALAQIVHDVAPRSRLGFHTGFNGQADFAEGIRELASGFVADVLVDDVLYFDEPYFQDGPVGRAVDAVHEQGVVYVAAAGNASDRSYEAPFRDSGQTGFYQGLGETRRHDFDPGPGVDVFQAITLRPFAQTILMLQWDEPWASASTAVPPVGAASDYDLIVYNTETPTPGDFADVFARSDSFNPGGDAFEAVVLENPSPTPRVVYLAIERFELPGFDGPDAGLMKTIDFGSPIEQEWATGGGTSFGHANARRALGVGAAAWFETPRFGVSPPQLEPFSSAGGVPILFDGAGTRLPAPELRKTPDLVAPDGVNTTFFAAPGDTDDDDDAFPNFFGTSAAAPHAAGVAALLQGRAHGGAAILAPDGTLARAWMCFVWKSGHLRIPIPFTAKPEQIPGVLAAGATLGPCWKRTPAELERVLETTAVDMEAPGYDVDSGFGLVDARAALRKLLQLGASRGD